MSYQNGFEDATELCLKEVIRAKGKGEAINQIKYILGLVKEDKFDRIKKMLGAF